MKDNDEKSKIRIGNPVCGSKDPDLLKMSRIWNTDCGNITYLLLTMFRWLLPVFTTRQSTAITIICCWRCSDGCCRCSRPDSQQPSPLFAVDDVQMAVARVHDPTVNRHHHYLLLTMFRWLLPVFTTRQSTTITIICCWQCSDGCCRCSQPDSQPPSPPTSPASAASALTIWGRHRWGLAKELKYTRKAPYLETGSTCKFMLCTFFFIGAY